MAEHWLQWATSMHAGEASMTDLAGIGNSGGHGRGESREGPGRLQSIRSHRHIRPHSNIDEGTMRLPSRDHPPSLGPLEVLRLEDFRDQLL